MHKMPLSLTPGPLDPGAPSPSVVQAARQAMLHALGFKEPA